MPKIKGYKLTVTDKDKSTKSWRFKTREAAGKKAFVLAHAGWKKIKITKL